MNDLKSAILIFGGSGAIGTSISDLYKKNGWRVIIVSRDKPTDADTIQWDPCQSETPKEVIHKLREIGELQSVCWTQGMNLNDSVYSYNADSHVQMYQVNVVYILNSLRTLLDTSVLVKPAKFCVVSSIWQNLSRQNKLSYSVTKSALQGLVLSACNDLARDGHLFNAVLPGALETPMTRDNLQSDQIAAIEDSTQFRKLAEIGDVANAVYSLCSEINTGITGNFVTVDLGYSSVRNF